MKKILSCFLTLSILVCMLIPMSVFATTETMSDEFKALLNKEGKWEINAVAPATEEEWNNISTLLWDSLPSANFSAPADDFSSVDLTIHAYDGQSPETHTVEIEWNSDPVIAAEAASFIKNFPEDKTFYVKDMELINFWANDKNAFGMGDNFTNYCGEIKALADYKNFSFEIDNNSGAGDPFKTMRGGIASLQYEDTIYFTKWETYTIARHILYVPDDTATTKEALLAAAQKRINDYLGNNTTVVLQEGGTLDEIYFEECKMSDWGVSVGDYYFEALVNGQDRDLFLLVLPDSSKMVTPTYKTADIKTNIEVSSESSAIPLDTSIQASKLENDDVAYQQISQLLDIDDGSSFDIKLYSSSQENYVSSLTDDTFEVKIPVPSNLENQNLVAYYVDENNQITTHPVTLQNDFAVFTTDHFSIYTLSAKKESTAVINEETGKITVNAASGYELKAGSLIVTDTNGNTFVPQRTNFRKEGGATEYEVIDENFDPAGATVTAEFYQPTLDDPNIGNIGNAFNESLHGIRFISRFTREVIDDTEYMVTADGKKYEIMDYGMLLTSKPGLEYYDIDITDQSAVESSMVLNSQNRYVQKLSIREENVYYDTCDDHIDMAVTLINIDEVKGYSNPRAIDFYARSYVVVKLSNTETKVLYGNAFSCAYEDVYKASAE